jgi:hypothetical protein
VLTEEDKKRIEEVKEFLEGYVLTGNKLFLKTASNLLIDYEWEKAPNEDIEAHTNGL